MTRARRVAFGTLLFVVLLAILCPILIFPAMGAFLVRNDPLEHAAAVVVLAGDYRGNRVLRGAELVEAGYAPVILVSGPMRMYGVSEADLAIQFAVRHGVPAERLVPVYIEASSTLDEAHGFKAELRNRQISKILLVTSSYHTRRAAAVFRRVLGPSVTVRSVPAPDPFFQPDGWWHNREGQKTVFYEYSKTVADWLGI